MRHAPAQVRNPATQHHLVRLLPAQKLILTLTQPEFDGAEVYIKSDFLVLERDEPGRRITFRQKGDLSQVWAGGVFFLGEITIKGQQSPSLCLFLDADGGDRITAVNPNGQHCKVEPHQVLDVVYIVDWMTIIDCSVIQGKSVKLEQIDYKVVSVPQRTRTLLVENGIELGQWAEEHHFSFRYDAASIEWIQATPYGKYPAGTLLFYERNQTEEPFNATLNIHLNWREQKKGEVYKALLLPRNGFFQQPKQRNRHKPKQAVVRKATVTPLPYSDMETGCNVIFSRCY